MEVPQVVNVKVKHIRPKYKNLKEWCDDKNNLYCGRKGVVFIKKEDGSKVRYPPNNSTFHNPFKIKKNMTREDVLGKFRTYAENKFTKEEILSLKGLNLGCWCKPLPCHCDILIDLYKENVEGAEIYCESCDVYTEKCVTCTLCYVDLCEKCGTKGNVLDLAEWLNGLSNQCSVCKQIGCRHCMTTCYSCWNDGKEGVIYCNACSPLIPVCDVHVWDVCNKHDKCGQCEADKNYDKKY